MSSAHRYHWELADGRRREAWRAKWVGVGGKVRSKRGFTRQSDALAYASDREAETRHGVVLGGERLSGRTTVEGWSVTWLASVEVRASTLDAYRHAVRRINAGLGGRSLGALRASEIRTWRRTMTGVTGRPLAVSTADQTAAVLAMMLRAAVVDGLIPRSPMPPARDSGRAGRVVDPTELLSLEQVEGWAAAMPAHARAMPLLAAMTGMRQGELLGLRLDNVDFLRRTVRIVEQLQNREWGPPKTAAGIRTVPLTADAAQVLAQHLERFPAPAGEPIFRTARGERWRRQSFRNVWVAAAVTAGLPGWAHWHALRDVYASSLIRAGVDVRSVMVLMGHTSSEETLRTYARLWPDAQDVARRSLEGLWRTSQGQSGAREGAAHRLPGVLPDRRRSTDY